MISSEIIKTDPKKRFPVKSDVISSDTGIIMIGIYPYAKPV